MEGMEAASGLERTGVKNADITGNLKNRWHIGESQFWNTKNHLPEMQREPKKQKGSVSIRDVQNGWRCLEVLALFIRGRHIL